VTGRFSFSSLFLRRVPGSGNSTARGAASIRRGRRSRDARSQQEELHRVTAAIIISFKTKTAFRAAAETVKIASRRILLSNKKTGVKGAVLGTARAEAGKARRGVEKKGGGAWARGRAN